jgi:hypothetical protein
MEENEYMVIGCLNPVEAEMRGKNPFHSVLKCLGMT